MCLVKWACTQKLLVLWGKQVWALPIQTGYKAQTGPVIHAALAAAAMQQKLDQSISTLHDPSRMMEVDSGDI